MTTSHITPRLTRRKTMQMIRKMQAINTELESLGLDFYDIQKLWNEAMTGKNKRSA